MIQDQNAQNLAETLNKSGLAASAGEALRMAKNIIGTEEKVAKSFDDKNQRIDEELTKRRTYKEEIEYLIEKTSPEKKDFHIPIKGYKKDPEVSVEIKEEAVEEPEEEPKLEVIDLPEQEPVEEIKKQAPKVEAPEVPEIKDDAPEVKEVEDIPEFSVESEKEPVTLKVEEPEVKEIKPVQTDILDDDRTLNEIMAEDAENVYTNAPSQQEPEVFNELDEPSKNSEVMTNQPKTDENFIVDVESDTQEEKPDQKPEQLFKELKEEKSDEVKEPIDDVDLMDYFKFG